MSTDDKKPGVFSRLFGRSNLESAPEPVSEPVPEAAGAPATAEVPEPPAAETIAAVEPTPVLPSAPEPESEPPSGGGWFQRLKAGLSKTSSQLTSGITSVFTQRKLDAATIEDLEAGKV